MDRTEREILKSLRQLGKEIKMNPASDARIYDSLLNSFRETFPKKPEISYNFYSVLRPVAVSLLVLFFVFSGGLGIVYSAQNTLPGNVLYPVKRLSEKARMIFVFDQSDKIVLRAEILNNRLSEARILVKKAEAGDKASELELDTLAQNFTEELRVLKEKVNEQLPENQKVKEPFPAEDLLNTEQLDKGSLPIQDSRQIFAVVPSEEMEKLLSETKELLAEENLALAFIRIQEVEKLVNKEKPKKEQESLAEEKQPEPEQDKQEINKNNKEIKTLPVREKKPDAVKPLESSVGEISNKKEIKKDFQGGMQRAKNAETGMIREK